MTETLHRIVLASRPEHKPGLDNFRMEESALPEPAAGQFLARTLWLSLDPYMRGRMSAARSYAKPVEVGATMEGACVAEVVTSRHPGFAAGDIVLAQLGWASHGISDGAGVRKIDPAAAPVTTALGVLGMPGLTAWVGLNDIAGARAGETIVVSAATGAVGSLVGQLARRKGMRVIGIAGGAEKCAYAVAELGYDICLDHHGADARRLGAQIAEAAPNGVDAYFENVGGTVLEAVLPAMNTHGRIALCGMIAWYSGAPAALPAPAIWGAILRQRLRVQGFIIFDHWNRLPAFLAEVAPLVKDGSIRYRETVAEGLDAAPAAFLRLLEGGNFGKQLVRVG
ncbi:MAG: zinc-binding dehydrogenase [Rhodobacteraceae bacterium]|nr:zinc-binding dehydrogenase [Paracoccaceae bacterium]